jgi:UDP-N-acetylmuramoylalanine--D-glutamate ligase
MAQQTRTGMFQALSNFQIARDRAATLSQQNLIRLRNESLQELLSDFENTEHKLEYVKNIEGVDFVNDSRATNANAVWFALESMHQPVIWITNMNSIELIAEDLQQLIQERVKIVVIQGVYNTALEDFFKRMNKDVYSVMDMEDAVRTAFYAGSSEETVLFSPGVVSGGAYRTYRERGEKFKEAVAQL